MRAIQADLTEKAKRISAQLTPLFESEQAYLKTFLEAADHAVSAGGKRVRPVLTLLFAELCGNAAPADALQAALAIELLHSYTLVHDDLPSMDNDTERRGKPTVWAKYGEATAVLAGDYLQAKAFQCIAQCTTAAALLPILTRAAVEVIHGQVADIDATQQPSSAWSEQTLEMIYAGKTCALIAAACQMGAVAGGASADLAEKAFTFGYHLGMAFQLIDDLLDATQAQEGNEFNALAVCGGVEAVQARATQATQTALAALTAFPGDIMPLKVFAESLLKRQL